MSADTKAITSEGNALRISEQDQRAYAKARKAIARSIKQNAHLSNVPWKASAQIKRVYVRHYSDRPPRGTAHFHIYVTNATHPSGALDAQQENLKPTGRVFRVCGFPIEEIE